MNPSSFGCINLLLLFVEKLRALYSLYDFCTTKRNQFDVYLDPREQR